MPRDRLSDVSILLVEDDHGDAVLVRASLEEAGFTAEAVTWVRSLTDALARLGHEHGCVLLDLGLPDADGFSGVHKMVEAAPAAAVIVLTGRRERDGLEALAAGAQDYLVKDSINGELLQRSVRYAVERKRAQRTQEQLREARLSAAEQGRLERGLLPTPLLRPDSAICATYYRPGGDHAVLGGDFYDVVETPDGLIHALIGDVMGHGPDEAALGVHLRVAWRTLLLAGVAEADILPTMARLLAAEDSGQTRYVTVCDVAIAPSEMTIRVAGHPAPILCAGEDSCYLDLRVGPPLGVRRPNDAEVHWPENRAPIQPDACVMLYTDGLLDAYTVDHAAGDLGIPALVAAAAGYSAGNGDPREWLSALVGNAPRASVDDTAAVVLRLPTPVR